MSAEVRDLFGSLSDGWANPETHAAYLELISDSGLVRTAAKILATAERVHGALTAEQAGEEMAGLLQRFLDEVDDAGLDEEMYAVRGNFGSMWRVDWTEIGAAFLTGEQEAA